MLFGSQLTYSFATYTKWSLTNEAVLYCVCVNLIIVWFRRNYFSDQLIKRACRRCLRFDVSETSLLCSYWTRTFTKMEYFSVRSRIPFSNSVFVVFSWKEYSTNLIISTQHSPDYVRYNPGILLHNRLFTKWPLAYIYHWFRVNSHVRKIHMRIANVHATNQHTDSTHKREQLCDNIHNTIIRCICTVISRYLALVHTEHQHQLPYERMNAE